MAFASEAPWSLPRNSDIPRSYFLGQPCSNRMWPSYSPRGLAQDRKARELPEIESYIVPYLVGFDGAEMIVQARH
jgi:hypothetical protein